MTWDWADTLTLLGGTALVGYNLGRLQVEVRWRRVGRFLPNPVRLSRRASDPVATLKPLRDGTP